MTRKYKESELAELKRSVSILHVCADHGIELSQHGTSDMKGRCPFHEEDEPSFIVTPAKNLWHCMGCDKGGSVIDLVMQLENITFRQAVDNLMTSTGLLSRGSTASKATKEKKKSIPEAPQTEAAATPTIEPGRAAQLLERVATIYEKNLPQSSEALKYFASRGLDDTGQLAAHRAGYANDRLHEILPKSGKVLDDLKAIGVLSKSGREFFAGCVVFPVTDVDGNIVTLYGRNIGGGVKRHVFLPKRHTGLWNAPVIKRYSDIIVVESVLDALSVETAGFPNVVAIQGTNGLNDSDIADMFRHGVSRIILMLDGDKAGATACEKIRKRIETHSDLDKQTEPIRVELRILPEGHDPSSMLETYGIEKLSELILCERGVLPEEAFRTEPPSGSGDGARAEAEPATPREPSQKEIRVNPCQSVVHSPEQEPPTNSLTLSCGVRHYRLLGLDKGKRKLKVTIRVEHAGRLHIDTLDLYSARSRRTLLQDLCRLFEETPEIIESDITKLVKRCENAKEKDEGGKLKDEIPPISTEEKAIAEKFGKSPEIFENILADYETCGLVGEEANKLLVYLAAASRKMSEPLSVLILSSSGAGKTALQDAACGFVPPEDLVKLTSLSGKALFYKESNSLKHKVLALEEGSGAEEASYAIRNLISAGELVVEAAMKDPATGRIITMTNKVEGPTTVLMTTTNPEIDPETKSRFIVTAVDESRKQTRAILDFQRQREGLDGLFTSRTVDDTLKKHRNFQRLLKPLAIVNPIHGRLSYDDDRLQGRRDQPKYLAMIRAVAFLRQMQKQKHTGKSATGESVEYIKVDTEDIKLANRLAHELLGHSLDELSRPSRNLLEELEKMVMKRQEEAETGGQRSGCGGQKSETGNGGDSVHGGGGNGDRGSMRRVSFTRRQIREYTGWSNYRVHIHLKELAEFEYISAESDRLNNTHRYRLLYEGQGKDGSRFLPGLTNIE